jgi:hypothetical protein
MSQALSTLEEGFLLASLRIILGTASRISVIMAFSG